MLVLVLACVRPCMRAFFVNIVCLNACLPVFVTVKPPLAGSGALQGLGQDAAPQARHRPGGHRRDLVRILELLRVPVPLIAFTLCDFSTDASF